MRGRPRPDRGIVGLKRTHHLIIWSAIGIFVLDQASKLLVVSFIDLYHGIVVIPGFFNLVHIRNRGVAFGIMNQPGHSLPFFIITAISLVVGACLVLWYLSSKQKNLLHGLGTSLIIGGIAGNVTDRLRVGSVIDFIDLYIGKFHWPSFNIADSAITIGTCLLALYLIIEQRSKHVS